MRARADAAGWLAGSGKHAVMHGWCDAFTGPAPHSSHRLHLPPTLSLPAVAFHPGRAVPVSKTEAKLVDRWEQSLGAGALTSVAVQGST